MKATKEVTMTAAQLRKEVTEGNTVLNRKGNRIPMSRMAKNDPKRKLEVTKKKTKDGLTYQLV